MAMSGIARLRIGAIDSFRPTGQPRDRRGATTGSARFRREVQSCHADRGDRCPGSAGHPVLSCPVPFKTITPTAKPKELQLWAVKEDAPFRRSMHLMQSDPSSGGYRG